MKYDVSVLVVTYNPDWEKLKLTIKSILIQKEINIQIVVSDDGSHNNLFDKIGNYFVEKGFTDFKLVSHEHNQGTVKNVLDGLKLCDGDYVKLISPGDFLSKDDVLSKWLDNIRKNQSVVSFSRAIYYCKEIKGYRAIKSYAHSQYFKNNTKVLKKYYLLFDDTQLGAATLGLKQVLLKYISMISNYAKYAEDTIYRVMIAMGEKISFYDVETIYYEYGTGISTNKDKEWHKIIMDDFSRTDELIISLISDERRFVKKFKLCSKAIKTGKFKDKLIRYIYVPSRLLFKLKCRFFPKMTSDNIDLDYVKSLTEEIENI